MGKYVVAQGWLASGNGYGLREYRAYLPNLLTGWKPQIAPAQQQMLRRIDDSLNKISNLPRKGLANGLFNWMNARDESIRSSIIEGVYSTTDSLAWARYAQQRAQGISEENDALTLGAVKQTVEAVALGQKMRDGSPCTVEDILHLQHQLFDETRERQIASRLRSVPIWVGPPHCSIEEASFVAPPENYVPDLLADLVDYLNTSNDPVGWQAAVVHAQFETIHPFEDGNGRTGRALIQTVFNARNVADSAVPISTFLSNNLPSYYQALQSYQTTVCDGYDFSARSGAINAFLELLSVCCEDAYRQCEAASRWTSQLVNKWNENTKSRSDSQFHVLLEKLHQMPILDSKLVAESVGVSAKTARLYVNKLLKAGVIKSLGNRRNRRFVVPELVTDLKHLSADGGGVTDADLDLPFWLRGDPIETTQVPSPAVSMICQHFGKNSKQQCCLPKGHAGHHRYT